MKIGFLSAPVSGHLNPMIALARRLRTRGHDVVFFGILDTERTVRAAGLDFVPFGERDHPLGSNAARWAALRPLRGIEVLRTTMGELMPPLLSTVLDELPDLIRRSGIAVMAIDTGFSFAQVASLAVGVPYIGVCNVMHTHPAGLLPLPFFDDPFEAPEPMRERCQLRMRSLGAMLAPMAELARSYSEGKGVATEQTDFAATASQLALVSQVPPAFDFPVADWPPQICSAGPFVDDDGRAHVPFPWERLTGERLIFASLGTMLNQHPALHAAIVGGARRLPDTQLVLVTGGDLDRGALGPVPSNAIVVDFAPQLALLRKAALCVTHGGLNTVLEALMAGVPLVAIPIGFEQFGNARRIAFHGVGRVSAFEEATAEHLAELMRLVLDDPSFAETARALGAKIAETDGTEVAADAIERALQGVQPREPQGGA